MSEPSLYRPPADLSTSAPPVQNEHEGVATVSPTGAPVFAQALIKGATAVVGVAAVLVTVLPEHTLGWKVCFGIVSFGAVLGISSQGVRRAQ